MEKNDEFNSYAGFTIGPIYEVLSSARKTRELWFGSYFFSWFMEKIIENICNNDNYVRDGEFKFLSPYIKFPFVETNSAIGKYHDRFIIGSTLDKDALFNIINDATKSTLDYFVDLIDATVNGVGANYISDTEKNAMEKLLSWYIQRNFLVLDKNAVDESKVVKVINSYLDSMEENRTLETGINDKTCFVCKALPAVIQTTIWVKEPGVVESESKEKDLCPLCFLKYHSLSNNKVIKKIGKRGCFKYPSVLDISAVDLLTDRVRKIIESKFGDKDYEFYDIAEAYKEAHKGTEYDIGNADSLLKKPYLKYFVIVQADGDNLGKVLDKYKDHSEVPLKFSKPLFDFAGEAGRIIEQFRGYPVYIGGDDILAFAPVAIKDGDGKTKTVIDLAIDLSSAYKCIVGGNNPETNLSVGMNIAYYKFPLSRALKNAREEVYKAKSGGKNALSLLFTKHSGHQEGFKFKFNSTDIIYFSSLLSKTLAGEINFPHTLHHNLYRFKELIAQVPDKCRLNAFFDNNFNEPIHSELYSGGIEEIRDYFSAVMFDCRPDDRLKCIESILSKLAFIKFLRGEE